MLAIIKRMFATYLEFPIVGRVRHLFFSNYRRSLGILHYVCNGLTISRHAHGYLSAKQLLLFIVEQIDVHTSERLQTYLLFCVLLLHH